MSATAKTAISLPQSVLEQASSLAQQFGVSQHRLLEIAIEDFIKNHQSPPPLDGSNKGMSWQHGANEPQPGIPISSRSRIINQGDVFWVSPQPSSQTDLGHHPHPYVVVQDNLFNHSRINSVVVCALTTNLKQANAPGNVLLDVGEANLPKQSVVVVSKVSTVNKSQLGETIGALTQQRVEQILAGMRFLQLSFFAR